MNAEVMVIVQERLGFRGTVALITLMNMICPFATDLYMPALPTMSQYFHSQTLVNFTMSGYFLAFAIGMFLFGPLSDKYGRNTILRGGAILFTLSSISCALAPGIYALIAGRVVMGLTAGAMITVSIALVKDCFHGTVRSRILAAIQAMAMIAPMIAPVCGAFLLQYTSWRGAFWLVSLFGTLIFGMSLLLQETVPPEARLQTGIFQSLGKLFVVMRNREFARLLLIFSLFNIPFMAYLGVASFIYIDHFQLSKTSFSLFFAMNAACSILGPVLFVKSLTKISPKRFALFCFFVSVCSGLFVISFGRTAPIGFLLSFVLFTIVSSAMRPFGTSILLRLQEGDTGSVSALINGFNTTFGSFGMFFGALVWTNVVAALGGLILLSMTSGCVAMLWFLRNHTALDQSL